MKARAVRVWRLDIAYPPGSHPDQPDNDPRAEWAPDTPDMAEIDHHEQETGAPVYRSETFRWPVERMFLSRSGAVVRATKLREWGSTVTIHRSRPVTWDDAPEEIR